MRNHVLADAAHVRREARVREELVDTGDVVALVEAHVLRHEHSRLGAPHDEAGEGRLEEHDGMPVRHGERQSDGYVVRLRQHVLLRALLATVRGIAPSGVSSRSGALGNAPSGASHRQSTP